MNKPRFRIGIGFAPDSMLDPKLCANHGQWSIPDPNDRSLPAQVREPDYSVASSANFTIVRSKPHPRKKAATRSAPTESFDSGCNRICIHVYTSDLWDRIHVVRFRHSMTKSDGDRLSSYRPFRPHRIALLRTSLRTCLFSHSLSETENHEITHIKKPPSQLTRRKVTPAIFRRMKRYH
jgi:hypothetical protein